MGKTNPSLKLSSFLLSKMEMEYCSCLKQENFPLLFFFTKLLELLNSIFAIRLKNAIQCYPLATETNTFKINII